jgi:3-phosphoinositide dependent protein kinase-1
VLTSKNVFLPSDFKNTSTIGCGNYSKVLKAKHKNTEQVYAVKIIDKKFMEKEKKFYQIYVENEVLNMCNHPNIIKIFGAYQDEEKVYLVLEHCTKGDLEEYIRNNCKLN